MKLKKTLITLLLYIFFPVGIIILSLNNQYIFLVSLIVIYFTTFYFLRKENIFRIIAGYYDKKGKSIKSLKNLYKAYKTKNSTIETANTFIYMLLKTSKYDKCGEIIEKVEKRYMEETEKELLLSNKALYLWKKNRIADSINIYTQLIEKHKSTSIYTAYGYILTLTDDLTKALEVNLEAYKYNSESKGIMDNLGLTYIKLNELDKAYDIYTKLLEKKPNFPEAYYNMAILMQLKYDLTDTKHYLKKALEKPFSGLSTISKKEVLKKIDQINRLQGTVV